MLLLCSALTFHITFPSGPTALTFAALFFGFIPGRAGAVWSHRCLCARWCASACTAGSGNVSQPRCNRCCHCHDVLHSGKSLVSMLSKATAMGNPAHLLTLPMCLLSRFRCSPSHWSSRQTWPLFLVRLSETKRRTEIQRRREIQGQKDRGKSGYRETERQKLRQRQRQRQKVAEAYTETQKQRPEGSQLLGSFTRHSRFSSQTTCSV